MAPTHRPSDAPRLTSRELARELGVSWLAIIKVAMLLGIGTWTPEGHFVLDPAAADQLRLVISNYARVADAAKPVAVELPETSLHDPGGKPAVC